MAMSAAAILSFSTTIASCYAFSSEPIKVLSQRQPRSISVPVLTVGFASRSDNNRDDDDDDSDNSININCDGTSKGVMAMLFERRTFKVRPPWETFSTSTQPPPPSELPSFSRFNANNDEVSYNNEDNDQHGDAHDLVDDVVEGDRTPVGASKHQNSHVDSSRVPFIGSIDVHDLTSIRETQVDNNNNSSNNNNNSSNNDNNSNNDDADMAVVISSTTRKYANRATLLESVLASKVQELHVMTNRAQLMEDVLQKIKNERHVMNTSTKATRAMTTTTIQQQQQQYQQHQQHQQQQQQHHHHDDALDTTAMDSLQQSSAKVNRAPTTILDVLIDSSTEELQTMTNRVRLMESTLLQMKNSLQEKEDVLQHERQTNVITVEALQNKIQRLNNTIVKLQSQLVELLDEIDELEHRLDTEVNDAILSTTTKYKDMIHTMTSEYKVSLLTIDKKWQQQIKNETDQLSLLLVQEQQDKKEYRKLYKKEHQRRKKESIKRAEAFQRALLATRIVNDSSRSRQLTTMSNSNTISKEEEEEKEALSVDLPKLLTVLAANSSNDTTTTTSNDDIVSPTIENKHGRSIIANNTNSIDDLINSSRQREEMLLTDIEELECDLSIANDRIHELETQLRQQTTDEQNKVLEQQQQLQEYLRAQLALYYDTIQDQTYQIMNQTQHITNMQYQYDEAMLIATRSVDAARRREESLLTNVEELENELATAMAEKNDADELKQKKNEEKEKKKVVMNMQERLVELEESLLQGSVREKTLIEHNEELSKELIQYVQMANRVKAKWNDHQNDEEQLEEEDGDDDITLIKKNRNIQVPQSQQLQQRQRRWLRPWSLLWGR